MWRADSKTDLRINRLDRARGLFWLASIRRRLNIGGNHA